MTTTIQIDFEALADIGARFQQQADATQTLLQALNQAFEPLQQGGWVGLGATAYIDEMETTVLPAIERLVEALAMTGKVTSAFTELMKTAEQEATAEVQAATDEGGNNSPTIRTAAATEAGSGTSVGNPISNQPSLSGNTSATPNGSQASSAPSSSADSASASNLGQFRDQPTGVGSNVNNEPSAKIWDRSTGEAATTPPTETEGNGLGLAVGLTAASPFAVLLGKAIKDRASKDNS